MSTKMDDMFAQAEAKEAVRKYFRERQRESRARRKEAMQSKHDAEVAKLRKVTADRAEIFIRWAEGLKIADNHTLAGEHFKLMDFQKDFYRKALKIGTSETWLIMGRKNGKTAMIALYIGAHSFGPFAADKRNQRIALVSLDQELSTSVMEWLQQIVEVNEIEGVTFKWSKPGEMLGHNGSKVSFLASGKFKGQGKSLDLAIADEIGLYDQNSRTMVSSMRSSTSAAGGRFVAISIRGHSDFVSEGEQRRDMDGVEFMHYACDPSLPVDDPENWKLGNPGLGQIKSIEYMERESAKALKTPSDMATFKSFDLNMPLAPDAVELVPMAYWQDCYDEGAEIEGEDVLIGFDGGKNLSMSAIVAIGKESGVLKAWGVFPAEPVNLLDRGINDGIFDKYLRMKAAGELTTHPGRVVDYMKMIRDVRDWLAERKCRIVKIGSDRVGHDHIQQAIVDLHLNAEWVKRGIGASATADGSNDIRSFQRLVAMKGLRVKPSLLMEEAISNAVLRHDGAGNPALDKRKVNCRIDVAQAAVIAVGMYDREDEDDWTLGW